MVYKVDDKWFFYISSCLCVSYGNSLRDTRNIPEYGRKFWGVRYCSHFHSPPWMLLTGSLPLMLFIHHQITLYLDYLRSCIYHEGIIQKCSYGPPKTFLVALYTNNHIKHQIGTTINHPKCERDFSQKSTYSLFISGNNLHQNHNGNHRETDSNPITYFRYPKWLLNNSKT